VHQTFLAVDHVLGSGVSLLRQKRSQNAALGGHGIDGVFHHGQLARYRRAQRAVARSGNADGVLNLLPGQVERATRDDGRGEGGERGVMPAALADAGECGFAQTHLELVAEHESDNQFLAVAFGALAQGHCRGEMSEGWDGSCFQ